MAETMRVELDGALAGKHVILNADELTFGLVEDIQSNQASAVLDGLASVIIEGDLPKGCDRAGLRRLKPAEIAALLKGVGQSFQMPKS
jgi:hypothetical protein